VTFGANGDSSNGFGMKREFRANVSNSFCLRRAEWLSFRRDGLVFVFCSEALSGMQLLSVRLLSPIFCVFLLYQLVPVVRKMDKGA
jgi:hypothetical protein